MRQWKVGAITGGVLLIAIGALWLLQPFLPVSFANVLLYAWPLICIFLGIEILVLHFRQKEEKLKISFACILLLITIGGVSLLFNMGQLALNELGFSFQTASYELNETLASTDTIEEVIITVPDYHMTVTGTDEQAVNVTGVIRGNMESEELLGEQFNNQFSMKQVGNRVFVEGENISNFTDTTAGTLHISVPDDADIRVTVDYGNIDMNNVNGSAVLETSSGNITATQFSGSLTAQSFGGNIRVENSSLTSNSMLETSSGNIILNLQQDDSLSLDATVQYGEIKGNIDWEITSSENEFEEEQQRGTAQIGDGTNSIILVADSGNIVVNR